METDGEMKWEEMIGVRDLLFVFHFQPLQKQRNIKNSSLLDVEQRGLALDYM